MGSGVADAGWDAREQNARGRMAKDPDAMRILVTGGAGFIGSHLVEAALARGWEVRVLDSLVTGTLANLQPVAKQVDLVKGDIRDLAACDKAVHGCDAVFHLAALPSVQRSVEDPSGSHAGNCTGTVNVWSPPGPAASGAWSTPPPPPFTATPQLPGRHPAPPVPLCGLQAGRRALRPGLLRLHGA